MITLSIIEEVDISRIKSWPKYKGIHAQMDYAIREGGWLDAYCNNTDNYCYIVKNGELRIGFSLLINTGTSEAEFRIVIHPDYLGSGFGSEVVKETLHIGFIEKDLELITLIVRKKNLMAQKLYKKHGFILCGEKIENIQGQDIEFFVMEMFRDQIIEGEI